MNTRSGAVLPVYMQISQNTWGYVDTAANAIAVLRVGWVAQFGEDANVIGS
jgi:hypothetical protein